MDLLSMIIESRNRFTPLSLSPALWLDASDSNTLYDATVGGNIVTAGGIIARWEDRSGNNRHATQSLSANRPTRQTGILNGRDVVLFDGSNDFLASVAFGGNETWTRFVVVQSLNDSQSKVIIAHASNFQAPVSGADYLSVNAKRLEISQNGFTGTSKLSQKLSLSALIPSTSFVIASQQCNGTHVGNIGRINGETHSVTNPFLNDPGNFTKVNTAYGIGAYSTGTFPCHCNIAEVLHFPTALSESQRKQVENYLSSKWGIPTYDSDALDYFNRVEAAGSTINADNKNAINQFIIGCKEDGNWTSIKASCILAGADTLSGALVPLVGTAPTNVGFLSGDYSTTRGLIGGTSKRLDTGRADNADPQDNCHAAVWVTETGTPTSSGIIGSNSSPAVPQRLIWRPQTNCNEASGFGYTIATGLVGISRSLSGSYIQRNGRISNTLGFISTGTSASNLAVFARNTAGVSPWNGSASFYSIGESINLALLDTRLAKLMNSLRPTYDVTALDYFARVEAAGSTISSANQTAVNTLFLTLKAQSLWTLISELYLFAGVDNLTGCLVKAKGSGSLSNTSFVNGDHNRTTGLLGDGSSKYLNTGFASNALSGTSNHIFVEGSGFETSGNPCAVGVFNGVEASILSLDFNNGASGRLYRCGRNTTATIPRITTGLISSGSFCGTRPSSASASIYQNGSPANTNTTATSPAFSTRPMFVFALNNIGSPSTYTAARLRAVSIGSGLSDSQVSSLHTAISTYMSSLT